jgi:hypothetical protein
VWAKSPICTGLVIDLHAPHVTLNRRFVKACAKLLVWFYQTRSLMHANGLLCVPHANLRFAYPGGVWGNQIKNLVIDLV